MVHCPPNLSKVGELPMSPLHGGLIDQGAVSFIIDGAAIHATAP